MLFAKDQTVDELIVQELSYRPKQDIGQLQKRLVSRLKNPLTIQAWYKALRRLIEEGVVVKQKKYYSLNVSWTMDILRWSLDMKTVYIEKPSESIIVLPHQNQKIKFRFPNLLAMNSFWAHLLVYIASRCAKKPILYAYNPHFWFYLAHGEVEKQYNRSMKAFNMRTYMIIGSDSFLDKWNAQFFDKTITQYCLSPISIFQDRQKYFNYIDKYFIEITIQKDVAQSIHYLFERINSLADISQIELIQKKSSCMIHVSKSSQKGEKFKRKISRYFVKRDKLNF